MAIVNRVGGGLKGAMVRKAVGVRVLAMVVVLVRRRAVGVGVVL